MPVAVKVQVELSHERDTKNKHVFSTQADGVPITNIYVNKGAFGDETPANIVVIATPGKLKK